MKATFTFAGLLLTFAISAQTSVLNLKFPSNTYVSSTPGQPSSSLVYSATSKLAAIDIFTSDGLKSPKLNVNAQERMGAGRRSFLLAIPKLYEVASSGATRTFKFGQNGGEDNFDDATVQISYTDRPANTSTVNNTPIMLRIADNEILTINKTSTESGSTGARQFLLVEASSSNTANIQITRQSKQGNVMVCVFRENNGRLVATLDPKHPTNTGSPISVTVNRNVYVIPVIRPKTTEEGGVTTVVFEVGDPRNNGTVEVDEEG
jgi:hypothetical protein